MSMGLPVLFICAPRPAGPRPRDGQQHALPYLYARLGRRGPSPATASSTRCLIYMRASAGGAPAPRRPAARAALQRAELGVLNAGQIELPGGEPLAYLRDRGAQDASLL